MRESASSVFAVSHSAWVRTGSRPALPHEPDVTNEYSVGGGATGGNMGGDGGGGGGRAGGAGGGGGGTMPGEQGVGDGGGGEGGIGGGWIHLQRQLDDEEQLIVLAVNALNLSEPYGPELKEQKGGYQLLTSAYAVVSLSASSAAPRSHSSKPTTLSKPALAQVPDVTRTYGVGGAGEGGGGGEGGGAGGCGGEGGCGSGAIPGG